MGETVKTSFFLERKSISVNGEKSLHVLLEMEGIEFKPDFERMPLNLSLVIDRSGSMTGMPLEYCKQAASFVIQQLSQQDILSLVAFESEVKTVLQPGYIENKEALQQKVSRIETGGLTNLSGGLLKGCQHVLKHIDNKAVHRVILLTDGYANQGITNPEGLRNIVHEFSGRGLHVTAMGMGGDFDEEVIESIAEAGKGNFAYIKSPEQIPSAFEKELTGLLRMVAQNVELRLKLPQGVKVKKAYGYSPEEADGLFNLSIGDIYASEKKSVLLELEVEPGGEEGIFDLLKIDATYVSIADHVHDIHLQFNVPAEKTGDEEKLSEEPNPYVMKQLEISRSATVIEEALSYFDNGDIEAGKDLLQTNMMNMAVMAAELGDEDLKQEAENMQIQLENFTYDPETRKQLHAEKYRRNKRKKQ